MNTARLGWALLALVVGAIGLAFYAEQRGYAKGLAAAAAAQNAQLVRDQSSAIETIYEEVKRGATLNTEVRTAMADVLRGQRSSAQELKDALSKDRPVICRFDVDVMRHLGTAADRADDLAARGLRAVGRAGDAVPASGQGAGQQ